MANKQYDFVAKRKLFVIIPCAIIAVALIVFAVAGLEVAIEFKGGTLLTYSYSGDIDLQEVTSAVDSLGHGTVRVTRGTAIGGTLETFTVAFTTNTGISSDVQQEVSTKVTTDFAANNVELLSSQDVSPSTGSSFFLKCLVAVIFSFIVLVIYIALRFKKIGGWSAGVFAIVALLCDVLMVFASFVFFRFSIDANFMAVVLTVLGYSINNTIVVYDRIRENRQVYGKKLSYTELVNKSINQSVTRSVNTTVTTGSAVLVICIIAVALGVPSILSFAFPMLIGLISGLFSSLCLSGSLWAGWQEHKLKKAPAGKK